MSIDQLVREAISAELKPLRQRIQQLEVEVEAAKSGLKRPVYDYNTLRELGYSHHESRRILRSHGHKQNGRYRVTVDQLLAYQKGA